MIKWLKKHVKIFYIKYVLGQCKHICLLCEYKEICYEHLYDEIESGLINQLNQIR